MIQISRKYRALLKKTMKAARKKYHLKLKTMRYNDITGGKKEIKVVKNAL